MFNRDVEEQVLNFCATQREMFSPEKWLDNYGFPNNKTELAVVALFLAGGDWYGQQVELESIAEKLCPGCIGHFSELVKETHFECSRFSNMLKKHLGVK